MEILFHKFINKRDSFCTNCWRYEKFFKEGHSWSPDLCSCGCEDTKPWYKMNIFDKLKANKKHKEDTKRGVNRNRWK